MNIFQKKIRNAGVSYRALYILLREGFSFQMHVLSGIITILLSLLFHISMAEFLIVILVIGSVLSVEALNTALEELCNHITPDQHPQIGKIKDLSSGASGIIGITALIIGYIIFIPHFIALL